MPVDPITFQRSNEADQDYVDVIYSNIKEGNHMIGQVYMEGTIYSKSIIRILRRAWERYGSIWILHLREDLFVFVREDKSDSTRIIELEPWFVMGFPIIIQPWYPTKKIEDVDFLTICYWL